MRIFLAASLFLSGSAFAGDLDWYLLQNHGEIDIGGFVHEMHAVRLIHDEEARDVRIVYGDRLGLVHSVRHKNGRFQEEWVSPKLRGPIAEVFVRDVNDDEKVEIVAYTELGEIIIFRADDYQELWRSTDDEFKTISSMVVENVDDDAQLEMVFTAESVADVASFQPSFRGSAPGELEADRESQIARLYVYDCLNLFMEWSTEQGLSAQSIVVADLDDDGILEIALNTGFVVDAAFQRVEWQWQDGFGQTIGYADLDGDDIPELIGEYRSATRPRRSIRVFDVDLQAENFLSSER
ncbi:TPA: hypothetical protein DCE37_17305 [Candidatus Latescibacteria bacterium]|nr:hypothetical protein [Candidatus Latescibacterota bacterium]